MVGFGEMILIGEAVSAYLGGGFAPLELERVLPVVIGAMALAGMILTF